MTAKDQRSFKFWQELKRRNVPRVMAIYAGTAFIILEAADIIFPRWGFPDWTVDLVLYLLLVGAVLPLKIIGDDSELSFFASGLVETLTHMLSKDQITMGGSILNKDSLFAMAYAGVARAYTLKYQFTLDPDSHLSHDYLYYYRGDFEANESFRNAIPIGQQDSADFYIQRFKAPDNQEEIDAPGALKRGVGWRDVRYSPFYAKLEENEDFQEMIACAEKQMN